LTAAAISPDQALTGPFFCPVQIGQRGEHPVLCKSLCERILTYGGEVFALICISRGHIVPLAPRNSERPAKRCCRCGCLNGHATGCDELAKSRRMPKGWSL
jgi:hypothetical protein